MKASLLCPFSSGQALLAALLLFTACSRSTETAAARGPGAAVSIPGSAQHIRQAAVAGLFYPRDAGELSKAVDQCLAAVATNRLQGVRALICPHAGYPYSGPVAAQSYQQVVAGTYDTVIIIAASHYALFQGVSVPASEAYETPLGLVPVSAKARELAQHAPFVLEPRCRVQRPAWSAVSSKAAPAAGEDTPETWEHSVEVQVPFLQRALKKFSILPVLFGRADPEKVAAGLAPLVDDKTLVVASTDLSHYHSYAEARALDTETVGWIRDANLAALQAPEAEDRACGQMPVLALLHLARLKGWKAQVLGYRNSGDTAGDKSRVVGYAAVAFVQPGGAAVLEKPLIGAPTTAQFSPAERQFLLGLARETLTLVTAGRDFPAVDLSIVPTTCRTEKGCFVTLTKAGELRGCIGNILPAGPLYRAVMLNARNAALRDPRFPPVTASEAAQLHIEISVLTTPEPLPFSSPDDLLAKLQPRRDGVVLSIDGHSATFLPQVWEQLPDKIEFLSHLAAKSGSAPLAWRGRNVSVMTYRSEAFEEAK